MDKLPVYEMVIDPNAASDVEVNFIAFVDKPAIERNFLTFAAEKSYFALNEEQRIVSGPAMVAESLIYRRDQQGEYNVFFSADTIKQIALKFFKKDYQKNLNLFHDPNLPLDGVTIFESFVSDKSRGIQPMKGFEDLPDGSWFISAKIENDQLWAKIKSGEVKGFSVEGIFSYITKQKHGATFEELAELQISNGLKMLSGTQGTTTHLNEKDIMSSVKEMMASFKEKFFGPAAPAAAPAPTQTLATDYTTKDGVVVSVDKLEVGGVAMVNGAPAPAGDYELQDGTCFTVGDGGAIASVQPCAPADPNAAPAMSSDYSAQFAEINEKFSAYEARFAEQTNTISQLSQSFQKQSETIQGLVAIVEKMADTPTADPVQGSGNTFSTQKTVDKYEKRKELAALLSNLNKNKK